MKSSTWLALVVVVVGGAGCRTPALQKSDPPAETRQAAKVAEVPQVKESAQDRQAPPARQVPAAGVSQIQQTSAVVGETITLPSGLKYQEQWIGRGREVKKGDILVVHYTGYLVTTKEVFDSSIGRDPLEFKVGAGMVIKGWDEGVVGMRVGGKRILIIPANLAYGKERKGPIPPNSDLQFEIEVLRTVN